MDIGKFECFFMRSMQCWGWGTWRNRWNKFTDDPFSSDPYFLKSIFNKKMISDFDLNLKRSYFWSQVEDNASGKLNNTWDIFWYSFIFRNQGLCLTPTNSLTRNIGHDGSGVHSIFDQEILSAPIFNQKIRFFPNKYEENIQYLNLIKKYLNKKLNLKTRLSRKIKKFLVFCKNKIF